MAKFCHNNSRFQFESLIIPNHLDGWVFACMPKSAPEPNCWIREIAVSMDWYCTVHKWSGMWSLIELPSGNDRWCISRNSPDNFFGTSPKRETLRLINGGLQFY